MFGVRFRTKKTEQTLLNVRFFSFEKVGEYRFRADVDLPKNLFYEKVLFFTQLSYHLMCKLLKNLTCYLLSNQCTANILPKVYVYWQNILCIHVSRGALFFQQKKWIFKFAFQTCSMYVLTYVQTLRSITHMTKSIRITAFLVWILLTFLKISLLMVKADEEQILLRFNF